MQPFWRIKGRTRWSRARRAASYFALFWSVFITADLLFDIGAFAEWAAVAPLLLFALIYFLMVVVGVIFLTSADFRPNARRLATDTTISIIFTILAFSLAYRLGGISLGEVCSDVFENRDYVYFSAVTFSTLGYGDFRPCPDMRLIAAFQAIFGNLHLGLIVGSAFFLAQEQSHASDEPASNDDKRSNNEHS